MYFASGPPRSYALPPAPAPTSGERVEDVALASDPLQRVVARITSTSIALWTSSPRARRFHAPRLLTTVARAGRFVEAAQRARHDSSPFLGGVADGGCTDTPQIFAEWVASDRLAVVERGSQYVEFYAFDGLPADADPLSDPQARDERSGGTPGVTPLSPASSAKIQGRFVDDYPVNQGESPRDRADVAWSMSGVTGGKYLFVGMESGLVCVLQLAVERRHYRGDGSVVGLWKIDVIAHLLPSSPTPENEDEVAPHSPPSCYAITAATSDPVTHISKLALVACFNGGKCFIMLVSPASRTIEQLLSLVNTERGSSPSCLGKCTTATLDASGTRLALGWSDGGVSLFRLVLRRLPPTAPSDKASESTTTPPQQFHLEPLRELSMTPWGYSTQDIGGVTALAWTHDARAVAIGYELRGFAVFSTDGCRLMASLPQHNQDRVTSTSVDDVTQVKEACPFGALRLAWTKESTSLLVVPRGVAFDVEMPAELVEEEVQIEEPAEPTPPPVLRVDDLVDRVDVELLKEKGGLCLSLSGAPGRCGAWVRSDNSFTRRRDGGGIGPAEASQQIKGGDLLVAINGMEEVVNLPFEQIIQLIKGLPDDSTVTLGFLRLKWETVFPLASRALTSRAFLTQHGIHALLDAEEEDLCVREYALRMQEEFGDCDQHERPSLLVFEERAKFDGWEALQGTTKRIAQHKYIKLLFALFPVWNPLHLLNVLVDFWAEDHALQDDDDAMQLAQLRRLSLSPRSRQRSISSEFETFPPVPTTTTRRRRVSRVAFAEFDFARTPALANKHSKLFLVEDASIRKLSSPSLDDPCALMSAQSWRVPQAYDASCCPLRMVAASKSGQQIAVAGQRGFCLLNVATGKWRLFGNVHEEQDMLVQSFQWLGDDAIIVAFSRFREQHDVLHMVAFPRNHLDEQSILAALAFPRDQLHSQDASGSSANSGVIVAMETDDSEENVFCLLRRELWCIGVECTGSIAALGVDLAVSLTLKRQVKLPSSILDSASSMSSTLARGPGLVDFTVIPRALNVQTRDHGARSKSLDENDSDGGGVGWLASLVNMIAGGEVPDQYQPEEVLPRFALLNADGDVIVWDPEQRSQRLLMSNVTTMARLYLPLEACDAWPTPCRLMYGLYGPEGMRLWLPLLDGVYLSHTKAFDQDAERLRTFLACHDPLRAKTYEIEFGTAPATAELYEHVVKEYGVELEGFVAAPSMRQPLEDGPRNLRGCTTTVDDPASQDVMLRFDSDVTLVGMQHAFGLLVGVSQDVYMPPGALSLPCYDVFSRVQPFFHAVLTLLVRNEQLTWAAQIIAALRRNQFALSSTTQELFLHAMLEACFKKQIPLATFQKATKLLQPSPANESSDHSGDMDEYCEIVAHVGRKSEPSRLKLLFPTAGDPVKLLGVCRQRGELRTAANFLLILGECSTAEEGEKGDDEATQTTDVAFRSACAAELVAQCIEQDEWALATHVVRVAREWVDEDHQGTCFIDEQLSKICWQDLVSGRFDRVVTCLKELQAELPHLNGADLGIVEAEREAIAQRVHDTFVPSGKVQDLSLLLEAVIRAKYDHWTLLLQRVLAAATESSSG